LPNSSLFAGPEKTADMISISSKGICGEDDLGCPRLKKARLPAGIGGGLKVEKRRYSMDMGGF
jgi:hypothetical protein